MTACLGALEAMPALLPPCATVVQAAYCNQWQHHTHPALACAGRNTNGQLGDGTTDWQTAPVLVATDLVFVDITAGADHACGLLANGSYACWGKDPCRRPHVLAAHPPHAARHACSRLSSYAGNNEYGQLADGTTNQHLTPTLVASASPFKAIASGPTAQHTLFLQVITCFP